jgi:signal transduction histidine kinase/CheY-like chemotaxis protein/HPt (histidine-containing phosphotransfer) domain-containing protein
MEGIYSLMARSQITRSTLIMAERVRLFYGGLGFSALANLFLCTVLVWFAGGPKTPEIAFWAGGMVLLAVIQIIFWLAWFRIQPSGQQAWKWQYFPLAPQLLIGLGWGLAVAYPFPDYTDSVSILLALAGAVGILLSVILLSALEAVTLLLFLGSLLPLVVRLTESGQLPAYSQSMLIVAAIVALGLVAAAMSVLYGIISRLRAGKRNVSGKLDLVKSEVEGLHTRLSAEDVRRRDAEQALYLAKGEAETAHMVKSEFLATISHEIRTPLNGIVPLLEILRDTRLDEEQRQFVNTALSSSHHLLSIINDILDFSKIEAGKLDLEIIDFNLYELVESVIILMSKIAERRGLKLSCKFGEGIPQRVLGDPIRLRQVLTNLVSNAIKFTEKGSILVEVNLRENQRGESEMIFAVKDTGVGIGKELQSRLFRSFSQADASTTRKHGGTGLGLVISKHLVELMRGKIGVNSEQGRGSVFWFTMPLEISDDQPSTQATLQGVRVLVVGQPDKELQQLNRQLGAWGVVSDQTDDIADAVSNLMAVSNAGERWSYRLVIVDADYFSRETGEFLDAIGKSEALAGLPVLLLGEGGLSEETLGHDRRIEQLPLPAKKRELYLALCHLVEVSAEGAGSSSGRSLLEDEDLAFLEEEEPGAFEQAYKVDGRGRDTLLVGRVLVVEDNPVNLGVTLKLLQRLGLECEVAEDGVQALQAVERKQYDVVMMDCQMPRMDGYEATQAIRLRESSQGLPHLPIIAMTANAMSGDREKCIRAGMDDYLSKPLIPSRLQSAMRHWLPMREFLPGFDDLEQPEEESGMVLEDTQASELQSDEKVIARDVIDELYEIMEDDFTALLETFLENAPGLVDELEAAITQGDAGQAIIPSHSLKSSSANVGAMRLSKVARQIEMAARDGDIDLVRGSFEQLSEEFGRASRELSAICKRGSY